MLRPPDRLQWTRAKEAGIKYHCTFALSPKGAHAGASASACWPNCQVPRAPAVRRWARSATTKIDKIEEVVLQQLELARR
jgi:hypothetical protein